MPVTIAHPAAILPFLKIRRGMLIPLVIGSMTPDFFYYLPSRIGNHAPNLHLPVYAFSLGAVIALALCALASASPAFLSAGLWGKHRSAVSLALQSFSFSPRGWLLGAIGASLGIATHLFGTRSGKRAAGSWNTPPS